MKQMCARPNVRTRKHKDGVKIEWDLCSARLSDEAYDTLTAFIDSYYQQTQWDSAGQATGQWGLTEGWMLVSEEHADELITRLLHMLSDHRFHHVWDEPWLDVPESMKGDPEKQWTERLATVKDKFPGDFGDHPLADFNASCN